MGNTQQTAGLSQGLEASGSRSALQDPRAGVRAPLPRVARRLHDRPQILSNEGGSVLADIGLHRPHDSISGGMLPSDARRQALRLASQILREDGPRYEEMSDGTSHQSHHP